MSSFNTPLLLDKSSTLLLFSSLMHHINNFLISLSTPPSLMHLFHTTYLFISLYTSSTLLFSSLTHHTTYCFYSLSTLPSLTHHNIIDEPYINFPPPPILFTFSTVNLFLSCFLPSPLYTSSTPLLLYPL